MHVKTDRFGRTCIMRAPVSHVPSLEVRVTRVLSGYGMSTTAGGRMHTRACDLVRKHPSLTAQQAVDFLIAQVNPTYV